LEELNKTKGTWNSRALALAGVLAALYAADVIFFAPISFQVVQVRVADVLLPLSIIFGPPAIAGLTLGVLVGNLFGSPFGPVDIIGGTIANLVATTLAWMICRRQFRGAWVMATLVEILVVGTIVGGYLGMLTNQPAWLAVAEVMAGEAVAVGLGGYVLLRAVGKVLGPTGAKRLENHS
jgi:uncharacterized membrane protein